MLHTDKMLYDGNDLTIRFKGVKLEENSSYFLVDQDAFTLIEMLVAIAITAILLAISLSSLVSAERVAKEGVCMENVHTLVAAGQLWIADNNGIVPEGHASGFNPGDYWYNSQLIPNYIPAELRCPLDQNLPGLGFRYAFNDCIRGYFPRLDAIPVPLSRVVFVSEMYYFGDGFWSSWHLTATQTGLETAGLLQDHAGSLNLGFLDGHVERVKAPLGANGLPDWSQPPVFAHDLNSGYYYDTAQFEYLSLGWTQW